MNATGIERAEAFRNRNLAYLRTQDRYRLRSILDDYVRDLVRLCPPVKGLQREAEHLLHAAATLLLLALLAPDGVLAAGIPRLVEESNTSTRTVVRASGWLRNACRTMNRPHRGRPGRGVNKYAAPFAIVTEVANRMRDYSRQRQRQGLERKRLRDKESPALRATSAHVAPALPAGKGVVGVGMGLSARLAEQRQRVARLLGTDAQDDDDGSGTAPVVVQVGNLQVKDVATPVTPVGLTAAQRAAAAVGWTPPKPKRRQRFNYDAAFRGSSI